MKEPLEYFKDSVFIFIKSICSKIMQIRAQLGLSRGDDKNDLNNSYNLHVDNTIHITKR